MPPEPPGTPAAPERPAAPDPGLAATARTLGPSQTTALSPPRALKPRKARTAAECEALEQLPNIGPSLADDLRSIGVTQPQELATRDAMALYQALCRTSGKRQDPCVLDTFLAATDFMRGADPRPWWTYTAQRKLKFGAL